MDCDICYSHYDHSIHKPYMLSCPHTFCISCVNKLTANKCPTCNAEIFIKNPNIALLNLISESSYDQLKDSFEKALNKLIEVKNEVRNKSETKLNKYLAKIDSAKESIKNEANKITQLVKSSELKLLTELSETQKYLKKKLRTPQSDLEREVKRLTEKKPSVEYNSFSEEELANLIKESNRIKRELNEFESEIDAFNENIEFTINENFSKNDGGPIGEIQTNKKKFEKFTQLARSSDDVKVAIDYIDKAIEVCPNKITNQYYFKAETLWSAGKFSESFDFYQKCVEKDPSDMHLYKTKARKFFFFERYEEALDEIQKALIIDSKDNYSLNLRGIILQKLKKFDEALTQFDEAIKLDPIDKFNNFADKGIVLMEMKNYQEALDCFNRAVELNYWSNYNIILKGTCLKHLNRLEEAISCCNEAIEQDEKNAAAYFLKSECLCEKKEFKSGLDVINKAFQIKPSDNEYSKLRNYILKALEENEDSNSKQLQSQ